MSLTRKRIVAALAFVLPISALVVAPAAHAANQKAKSHHSGSVHKASAHKSHKKHTAAPAS